MTSGILVTFEPITGAPHDIASRTGNPKPSCSEAKDEQLT